MVSCAMRFCVLDEGRCYGTVISAQKSILGHFDVIYRLAPPETYTCLFRSLMLSLVELGYGMMCFSGMASKSVSDSGEFNLSIELALVIDQETP